MSHLFIGSRRSTSYRRNRRALTCLRKLCRRYSIRRTCNSSAGNFTMSRHSWRNISPAARRYLIIRIETCLLYPRSSRCWPVSGETVVNLRILVTNNRFFQGPTGDIIAFEDPFGRVDPLPLNWISSWEVMLESVSFLVPTGNANRRMVSNIRACKQSLSFASRTRRATTWSCRSDTSWRTTATAE